MRWLERLLGDKRWRRPTGMSSPAKIARCSAPMLGVHSGERSQNARR